MKNEFLISRFEKSRPAIAYENGSGYWKNIRGHVVGEELNLVYHSRRLIFKYDGDLINHVGAKVADYPDKEMYIVERDVKLLDATE